MKNFKLVLLVGFSLAMFILPSIAVANPDPGCNPDDPCPIDSNIYMLIVGAIAFAAYKFMSAKQKKMAI